MYITYTYIGIFIATIYIHFVQCVWIYARTANGWMYWKGRGTYLISWYGNVSYNYTLGRVLSVRLHHASWCYGSWVLQYNKPWNILMLSCVSLNKLFNQQSRPLCLPCTPVTLTSNTNLCTRLQVVCFGDVLHNFLLGLYFGRYVIPKTLILYSI